MTERTITDDDLAALEKHFGAVVERSVADFMSRVGLMLSERIAAVVTAEIDRRVTRNNATPAAPSDIATIAEISAVRDISMGTIDGIVGIGTALAEAGVIERVDLSKVFSQMLGQQALRDGETRPAARYVLTSLRDVFAARVVRGKPN